MKKTGLLIGMTALCASSLAQTSKDAINDTRGWSGNIELGYKSTTGNTDESVLTYRQRILYESRDWTNTITLSADNNTSDSRKTQEHYYITEQLDYNITTVSYGFVRGTYDKDLFSGFDYQATAIIGYGHKIVDTDTFGFNVELGTGASFEEVEGAEDASASGLGFFSDEFVWKFAQTAELGQNLSVEYSTINTITRAQVFLRNQVLKHLALKLTYGAKYTSRVPNETENLDTEFLATIVFDY